MRGRSKIAVSGRHRHRIPFRSPAASSRLANHLDKQDPGVDGGHEYGEDKRLTAIRAQRSDGRDGRFRGDDENESSEYTARDRRRQPHEADREHIEQCDEPRGLGRLGSCCPPVIRLQHRTDVHADRDEDQPAPRWGRPRGRHEQLPHPSVVWPVTPGSLRYRRRRLRVARDAISRPLPRWTRAPPAAADSPLMARQAPPVDAAARRPQARTRRWTGSVGNRHGP